MKTSHTKNVVETLMPQKIDFTAKTTYYLENRIGTLSDRYLLQKQWYLLSRPSTSTSTLNKHISRLQSHYLSQ